MPLLIYIFADDADAAKTLLLGMLSVAREAARQNGPPSFDDTAECSLRHYFRRRGDYFFERACAGRHAAARAMRTKEGRGAFLAPDIVTRHIAAVELYRQSAGHTSRMPVPKKIHMKSTARQHTAQAALMMSTTMSRQRVADAFLFARQAMRYLLAHAQSHAARRR